MTKLMTFVLRFSVFIAAWALLVWISQKDEFLTRYVVIPLPLHFLIIFGAYSGIVVLYRSFTFNDCPEAAKEILTQIQEAKSDLKKRGFKHFD